MKAPQGIRQRILVTEWMDHSALTDLGNQFDLSYQPEWAVQREALMAAMPEVDGLIVRNLTQVDAHLLAAAKRLKVVGRLGVGLDNIDVQACTARGIKVCPATGANARAVAEYVMGAALLLLRGAFLSTPSVMAGEWPRPALATGQEVQGKVLGIVGFGSIGQCTAQLAGALGLQVRYLAGPSGRPPALPLGIHCQMLGSLDDLLSQSDVVSLHVPLNAQTRHLIGPAQIARMRPGAIIVNVSRGGVIDEAATIHALRNGQLGGAVIDVFDQEPLAPGNPWAGCPKVILTPHIAGLTCESNARVAHTVALAVTQVLTGR